MNDKKRIYILRRELRKLRELTYMPLDQRRERYRNERENKRSIVGRVASGAATGAAVGAGGAAVTSLRPEHVAKVRDTMKKLPLHARRKLSGGALAEALKRFR